MGELGITINDLGPCPECAGNHTMIFQDRKNEKWYVACGYHTKCGHRTKSHKELLDAADEWGLKENA